MYEPKNTEFSLYWHSGDFMTELAMVNVTGC